MIIGSVSENKDFEKRISITPEIAKKYISNGFEVIVENNLASHLGISDEEFLKEGCKVDNRESVLNKSNIVLQLNLPDEKSTNLLKEKNYVLIDVDDNGSGFDGINTDIFFEPYMTKKINGTGLGLAICKKIVEDHNGEINLLDSPNLGGAMVRISLRDMR